jgi:Holliday junction resolvase RusA-like endonuclease
MSNELLEFVILGEPASKANSRRLVYNKKTKRPLFIKSDKARSYLKDFQKQCPVKKPLLEGDLSVTMTIFYASRRPDLDESLILDAMEKRIYANDRQVREKHIFHRLDKENPRTLISIAPRESDPKSGGE